MYISSDYVEHVTAVARKLQASRRLLVITGAGISADSGLPTYRGIGGLYEQELTEDDVPIEQALSGSMMQRAPEITWKYIAQIEAACRGARPNVAHEKLVALEHGGRQVTVLTQNVDGFHRDAGSSDVIEMHGNIHELHCTECRFEQWVKNYAQLVSLPPRCTDCGAILRPRVVLFEEMLPQAALDRYYQVLDAGVDMVLSIGTTAAFPYIAGPVIEAAAQGIPTVEINPGTSEISRMVGHHLVERAAVALVDVSRALRAQRGNPDGV